jgi:diguanylate cyclase (GGDEF)-like protein
VMYAVRRWGRSGLAYLPKGHSLPEDTWRVRHRTLSWLLRAHVVGIFLFALLRDQGPLHSVSEAAVVALFACVGALTSRWRTLSSAMTALGLVTSSAVLVHLSGGTIEMHFHFFVMVCILTLYQDWLPFLMAIGFVVVHHGLMGTLAPEEVYNHPAAVAQPLRWALVHGAFVLAASAASIVAWKFNEEQALKDALTGLPNRRLLRDRLGHALARAERRSGSLAVLFLDLDRFKHVNDTFGHAGGDHLLTLVAERMRALVRPSDTAARLGGDEFAILVEDIVGEAEATYVAERLLGMFATPFTVRGSEVGVGASVGVALNTPGVTVDELLMQADTAMYEAKSQGRGGCQVFVMTAPDGPAVDARATSKDRVSAGPGAPAPRGPTAG